MHNFGAVPHNLAIEGTDLITPMLNAGETANLKLTGLAPGTESMEKGMFGMVTALVVA